MKKLIFLFAIAFVAPTFAATPVTVSLDASTGAYYFTMPAGNVTITQVLTIKSSAAVEQLIDAIGEVSYTDASKAKIDAARAAYDALTDEQKSLVTNYAALTDAEEAYDNLKASAEDQSSADSVVAAIAAIGEVSYTDASKAKIDAARAAYDALTGEQKSLVTNYAALTAAEAAYAALTPVTPDPPAPEPSALCYEALNESDIGASYMVKKSFALSGAVYDGCDVVGIVKLKLGKVKKGSSKISGSVTGLDGKKHTIKAFKLKGIDGASPQKVSLTVKGYGTMTVTIGGTEFAGSLGDWHVQSADVGGVWGGSSATVTVEMGDLTMFLGTVLSDFLPTNEVASASGAKWTFAKTSGIKWTKPKKGAALPEIYDATSEQGLVVDTSKGTNRSGLKLAYKPKKGTFKGKFSVYALEGEGAKTKLKKYKVKVSGVVVEGIGYGVAICKKPAASWSVSVR